FLQGVPGQTWAVTKSGGNFVVALRDDGICAVFARRAKQADVELFFNALVRSTAATGLPTQRRPDKVLQTPNGPIRYTSYVQGKPESTLRISLALSTSRSTTAGIQAMATLSLIRKAPPD
ncbi:MAG: NMCC_0638 family (lipo)protein, partial [Steroidobacteraceae bacterium]